MDDQPEMKTDFTESQSFDGLFRSKRMSEEALLKIPYWSPNLPEWKPIKDKNSILRIATIVSDRLYEGLLFEGEIFQLTPDNWKTTLDYGEIDLVLVESTWETSTGHWAHAQSGNNQEHQDLVEIINSAKEFNIPTAFWMTTDHLYHDLFNHFATHFDQVFCCDSRSLKLFENEEITAEYLPPCVQPALYNPFKYLNDDETEMRLEVIFDGWADIEKYPEQFSILREVSENHQLDIIESRYTIMKRRLGDSEFKKLIRGCASTNTRRSALKYAKCCLSFDTSISTPTTQQWLALESTASYSPVIHLGRLGKNDIRKQLVLCKESDDEILLELHRFQQDEHYLKRRAHLAWRETMSKHTFSHRLKSVCQTLSIDHDWVEYPKASLIAPTYRQDFISNILQTYNSQNYPNKELVIVINHDTPFSREDLGIDQEDKIELTYVPSEYFAGASLNIGHAMASGDYFFRIDDDDFYGSNYIQDQMLNLRAVSADRFGKIPCPFRFEGSEEVYFRKKRFQPFTIATGKDVATGDIWLGGNSIAGSRQHFTSQPYPDKSMSAADTVLNLNTPKTSIIASGDEFNIVAERRLDQSTHTWVADPEQLKNNADVFSSVDEFRI
jgi:hypothetical protein